MKHRNWFWGLFFLAAAVFIVASPTGMFGQIGVVSLLVSILLVAVIAKSLQERNFFGVFVPVALLYLIYRQPMAWPFISPWLLIAAALFATVGCSLIFCNGRFHRHGKWESHKWEHDCPQGENNFSTSTQTMDDNHPRARVSFGAAVKYLHADQLENAEFSVSFGAMEVYFDQAQLAANRAEVWVECSFGALKLYVPRHWRVVDELHTSLGGVDNHVRHAAPGEDAPVLILKGHVQFSGVEIWYV